MVSGDKGRTRNKDGVSMWRTLRTSNIDSCTCMEVKVSIRRKLVCHQSNLVVPHRNHTRSDDQSIAGHGSDVVESNSYAIK